MKRVILIFLLLAQISFLHTNKVSFDASSAVVLKQFLNVFNSVNQNSKVIFKLKRGTQVKVLNKKYSDSKINNLSKTWVKIKFLNDKTGYVLSKYIFIFKNFYRKWILCVPKNIKGSVTFYKNGKFLAVLNSYVFKNQGLKKFKGAKYAFIARGKYRLFNTSIIFSKSILREINQLKLYLYKYKKDNVLTFKEIFISKNFTGKSFQRVWRYY